MLQNRKIVSMPKRGVKVSEHIWRGLKKLVAERDNFQCQICSRSRPMNRLDFHHIVPKGRLHLGIIENILTMCRRCHRLLHDGLLDVSVDDLIDKHNLRHYLYVEGK